MTMSWAQANINRQSRLRRVTAIVIVLSQFVIYQVVTSTLRAIGFSAVGVLSLLLFFPVAYLLERHFQAAPDWVVVVIVLSIFLLEVCVALLIGMKVANGRLRTESYRWYIERSLQKSDTIYHVWVRRARRWSLFVPSALALFLLLFFPEAMAVTSHIFRPKAGQLRQYRMRVPFTWIIFQRFDEAESDHSFINLWSARGWIRSGRSSDLLLSSATLAFYRNAPLHDDDLPRHAQILSTEAVSFAGAAGTCREYRYLMHQTPPGDYRSISCSSDDGSIWAWFGGQLMDESDFYGMIGSLQKTK